MMEYDKKQKKKRYLKCIDNNISNLTIGKCYESEFDILYYSELFYYVKDDIDNYEMLFMKRFIDITRNHKIKKLL